MKIYGAVLAAVVVVSAVVFGIVWTSHLRDASRSFRDMADAEKAQHSSLAPPTALTTDQPIPSGDLPVFVQPTLNGNSDSHSAASDSQELFATRRKQLQRLIELRFHEVAGMTMKEFVELAPLPEAVDAILIVNESLIGIAEQCELLGIKTHPGFDLMEHSNLEEVPAGAKLYWRYGSDNGKATRGMPVMETRLAFKKNGRRPVTTAEVLALYAQNPGILEKKLSLDAAGSQYGDSRSLHLCRRSYVVYRKPEKETDPETIEKVVEEVELAMALTSRGHPDWGSPSFRK